MNLKDRWARLVGTWRKTHLVGDAVGVEGIERLADLSLFCILKGGERSVLPPGSLEWEGETVGVSPHRTAAARWRRFRELEDKRMRAFYIHTEGLDAIQRVEWRGYHDLFYCPNSCKCEPPWASEWRREVSDGHTGR